MGGVYLADEPSLGRQVALKILKPGLAQDTNYVRRFQQEAQAVARLTHPNIVAVYFIGRVGKTVFFSMEYVEGETLADRLKRDSKLPVDEALAFARQVAEGLACAHDADIIHRDIKPANLFVTTRDIVKIGDFGLAKKQDNDLSLTQTGNVVGSPYYMSPEQSTSRDIDHRSDIYSLGATLYHLVSGKPPYDADSPVEVLIRHVQDEVVPIESLPSPTRERFHSLVAKMMAKSVDERFQSGREVAMAIDELSSSLASTVSGIAPDGDLVLVDDERPMSTAVIPAGSVSPLEPAKEDEPEASGVVEDTGSESPWPDVDFTSPSSSSEVRYVERESSSGRWWMILALVMMVILGVIVVDAIKGPHAPTNSTSTPTPKPAKKKNASSGKTEKAKVPEKGATKEGQRGSGKGSGRRGAYFGNQQGVSQETKEAARGILEEAVSPPLLAYDFPTARANIIMLMGATEDPFLQKNLPNTLKLLDALVVLQSNLMISINAGRNTSAEGVEIEPGRRIVPRQATIVGLIYTTPGSKNQETVSWSALTPQAYFDIARDVLANTSETDGALLAFAWIYGLNEEVLPIAKTLMGHLGIEWTGADEDIKPGGVLFRTLFPDRVREGGGPGTGPGAGSGFRPGGRSGMGAGPQGRQPGMRSSGGPRLAPPR